MSESLYDDGQMASRPVGPDDLPDPDPRLAGFGGPPVRVDAPADRHPAGVPEGGQYR